MRTRNKTLAFTHLFTLSASSITRNIQKSKPNFNAKIRTKESPSTLDKVNNEFFKFKDHVQNEDQLYLAKYINELSQKDEWLAFLKIAPSTLSEFELSELVSAIFLSVFNVFTKKIKKSFNRMYRKISGYKTS